MLPVDKNIRKNIGFTTDGNFFYIHLKGYGLLKIGTGENDKMLGKVYIHKAYFMRDERCSLVYYNGKLLVRSQSPQSKPLILLDPETLEEMKESILICKN
jgi:hypothetical protein